MSARARLLPTMTGFDTVIISRAVPPFHVSSDKRRVYNNPVTSVTPAPIVDVTEPWG